MFDFVDNIIIGLLNSEASFLISNTYGLYLPSVIAIICFALIFNKKESSIYSFSFVAAITIGLLIPLLNFGGWHKVDTNFSAIYFFSAYPAIIFLYFAYKARKTGKTLKFNVAWVFLGTFSTSLFTDFYLSLYYMPDSFNISGIGGAGIMDGLIIVSTWVALCAAFINYAVSKGADRVELRLIPRSIWS